MIRWDDHNTCGQGAELGFVLVTSFGFDVAIELLRVLQEIFHGLILLPCQHDGEMLFPPFGAQDQGQISTIPRRPLTHTPR